MQIVGFPIRRLKHVLDIKVISLSCDCHVTCPHKLVTGHLIIFPSLKCSLRFTLTGIYPDMNIQEQYVCHALRIHMVFLDNAIQFLPLCSGPVSISMLYFPPVAVLLPQVCPRHLKLCSPCSITGLRQNIRHTANKLLFLSSNF